MMNVNSVYIHDLFLCMHRMQYTICETPQGEIYGETATFQLCIARSIQDFQQITAYKLETIIYNADQSIAR